MSPRGRRGACCDHEDMNTQLIKEIVSRIVPPSETWGVDHPWAMIRDSQAGR